MTADKITFEDAREIARRAARSEISDDVQTGRDSYLSDQTIEAAGCWFFFMDEEITATPAAEGVLRFSAYAVSKTGEVSFVYDFRDNPQQMTDYVEMFSLRATGQNEAATLGLAEFRRRYPSTDG